VTALSRSSIFSSESLPQGRPRLPRAAALALGLVVASELALHALQDRLPHPVLWGAGEASAKVAQVVAHAKEDPAGVDVLVLGPSHARTGISPYAMRKVQQGFTWSVYNGGVNGRTYSMLEFVLDHVYEPLLKPRLLVLTASPIIFTQSNWRMERSSDEFFDAPMPRALRATGLESVWREFMVEHVFLYRYRKRESGLERGFVGGKRIIDRYGFGTRLGLFTERERSNLLEGKHQYKDVFDRFAFGGPSLDAFIRIVENANARHQPVVVVNMPFRTDLLRLSARGPEAYRAYLKEMAALADHYRFAWLDYQEALTLSDRDFLDVDHLNYEGADKLSRRLANDLNPRLEQLSASRPRSERVAHRRGDGG
jgi:hypothetical protein